MCLPIAFSIMVSNNAPCCVSRSCCSAHSIRAAPVVDTLRFLRCATRSNSALTLGFRCKVVWIVCRLVMGRFCERDEFVFTCCGRRVIEGGAGWGEAARARLGVGLSCPTPLRGCCLLATDDCRAKTFCDKWVWTVFTIDSAGRKRQLHPTNFALVLQVRRS